MNPHTKRYVLAFRLNELKAVLERLRLPQTGRKAELQSRIHDYFGEPHSTGYITNIPRTTDPVRIQAAERIVEEVYCNWKALPTPQRQARAAELQQAGQPAVTPPQPLGAATAAAGPSSLQTPAQPLFQSRVETIPAGGSLSSGATSPLVNGKLLSPAARPAKCARTVSCICEHSRDVGVLVQCQGCGVSQHADCVGKREEAARAAVHFCELCRAAWADPFWEVKNSRVIPPIRLQVTGGPVARGAGGLNEPQRAADSTFQLSSLQMHLIQKAGNYQLQAVPLLLDDPVAFRFQWPRNSELKTNSVPYRVYSRQPTAKVGPNVRDEPADLSSTSYTGRNRIRLQEEDLEYIEVQTQLGRTWTPRERVWRDWVRDEQLLQANDTREFVLVVQLVKQRELGDVKRLMAPPESMAAALQRVKKQTGGGEDDDLTIGSTVVSLRDPLSGARIVTPARFLGTDALVAFDLDTFLKMAKRSRKWQCPHSMRHSRVQDLQADTFMTHVLSRLKDYPDVMEVEVSPEGEWRPAGGRYAWMQVTEQPISGPLPLAPKLEVKEECGAVDRGTAVDTIGANDDELEEELSEAEELRQAAVQYAKSARQVVQDVIVLDDSDDECVPSAKRAADGGQQTGFNAVDRYQRQRLMQPTIHSSLAAARSLNGAGASNQQASDLSAFRQAPTASTSTSGLSNANSTGARVSSGWTGASNIRISLPNRTNQSSRLMSSGQAGPTSSPAPQAHGAAQEASGIPSSRAPEPLNSPHGRAIYNPSSPSYYGYQQQQQQQQGGVMGMPPIGPPWSYAPHRPPSQGPEPPPGSNGWIHYTAPFSPVHGQQGSNAASRRTPSSFHMGQTMRPAAPSSMHGPPPAVMPSNGGTERLTDSWATGQGLSPAERDMLGSLLQDDAVSPQTRTNIAAAITSPSNQLAGQDNTVIDLDSD